MSVGRQALLEPENERLLKKELTKLWKDVKSDGSKYTGPEIARMLGFGVPGGPFERLKPLNVYHYRHKFDLPKRSEKINYPNRYSKGKQEEPMDLAEVIHGIEAIPSGSFHGKRMRTYNGLVFWSGLRNTEIRMLTPNDIEFTRDSLTINAFRLKKGDIPREQATYPLELRLGWMFVDEIESWVKRFKDDEKIWDVDRTQGWRWVKKAFPEHYPHFFRLNVITLMCSDPRFSIAEIRAWTGLHIVTINSYISKSGRFATTAADKMSQIMMEEQGGRIELVLPQIDKMTEVEKQELRAILGEN